MRKFIQIAGLLCILTILYSSCQDTASEGSSNRQKVMPVDKTALRKAPSQDAEEIATLTTSDTLSLTGILSTSTSRINFNGILYNDPWVEVMDKKQKKGWMYAANLYYSDQTEQSLFNKIIQRRLIYFTNESIAEKIGIYRNLYSSAKTSQDFHDLWELGDSLKPEIQKSLSAKIDFDDEEEVFPDFNWIESFLPGYITIVSGHQCYLFRDFISLAKIASKTNGTEDDDLVSVCQSVYSLDSIEYFDPSWNIEDETGGIHSLLGDGIHLEIACKIDTALYRSNLFQRELYQFKKAWMQDLASRNVSYWNDAPKIIKELEKILQLDLKMLNQSDKSTIETRIKMFQEAKKNDIIVNQRSGMN